MRVRERNGWRGGDLVGVVSPSMGVVACPCTVDSVHLANNLCHFGTMVAVLCAFDG